MNYVCYDQLVDFMNYLTVKGALSVKGKGRKVVKGVLAALIAVVLIGAAVLWSMFGSAVRTLGTIEREGETNLFTMTYRGDYGFDAFLEQGGAESDREVQDYVIRYLLKGLPFTFELPELGCSTISVQNVGGDGYLFGRNFELYDSPAMLVKTTPKDGYASLSMVNLAFIGYHKDHLPTSMADSITTLAGPYAPLDGMNEKGLCIGVLLIDTEQTNQDNGLPDITTSTAIRLVLDKAATVEEALELLADYDMHSSAGSCYHFQIADAAGRAVVVEYIGDQMTVVESPYATNFLLTPGEYDFGGGQDRFAVLEERYQAAEGRMTAEQVMDTLQAVSQDKRSQGKDTWTQWSVVYDTKNLTAKVCYGMAYDTVYTYSLAE